MASSSDKASKQNHTRKASTTSSHRASSALPKTEIIINVYDLLPPGRLSSLLWTTGFGLLHSGVAINSREYAYGGHNRRSVTGVYFTRPRFEPPGGTFRTSVLQGFTFSTPAEIEAIVKEVSDAFLGPGYNLLSQNCNHFTSALCERLTHRPAPAWLNRAAGIGIALPCMVPKDWISPPDVDTADGELLDVEDEAEDERASMIDSDRRRRQREGKADRGRREGVGLEEDGHEDEELAEERSLAGGKRIRTTSSPPPRLVSLTDSSGRDLPVAERAPIPKISAR